MTISEVTKGQTINGQTVKTVKKSPKGDFTTLTLADGTKIRRWSMMPVEDGRIR